MQASPVAALSALMPFCSFGSELIAAINSSLKTPCELIRPKKKIFLLDDLLEGHLEPHPNTDTPR
jgi:hypothetical protein